MAMDIKTPTRRSHSKVVADEKISDSEEDIFAADALPGLSTSAPHSRSRFFTTEDLKPKGGGKAKEPFVIGVTGGTASGKTTVCDLILKRLGNQRVTIISLDNFYRALTPDQIVRAHAAEYNFDHPDAFDWECLHDVLDGLRRGKTVNIPIYDFSLHSRVPDKFVTIHGSVTDVILFEGILSFHRDEIRDLFDMKLFVDTDADVRLARRVLRDMRERGRQLEGILLQYEKFVKPAFDHYIWPTKKYADVVIPRGSSNTVAIDLIAQHIRHQLDLRSQITK